MKSLAEAVVEALFFLELSDDDVVDPDAAVAAMESLTALLQRASLEEREALFAVAVFRLAQAEARHALRHEVDFYQKFAQFFAIDGDGSPSRGAQAQEADGVLERAARLGREFVAGLAARPVGQPVDVETLRRTLGGPLPDTGEDPRAVVEMLARGAEPGLVASAGPRYFGFVTGGALPAALGADWLTSAWDQNGWTYVASPAASVIEEVAGQWLVELLGLPPFTSVGFTS